MNDGEADELGELLEFLYVCPIALAQLSPEGRVEMANPAYSSLMVQIDPAGGMGNLIELLGRIDPELVQMVSSLSSSAGRICQDHPIVLGTVASSPFPLVVSLTMIKLARGRIMVTMADISSAAALRRSVEEANQRFRAIADGVRDYAIFALDAQGKVATWNLSAEKLFGIPLEGAMGRDFSALMPRENAGGERSRALQEGARTAGWSEDEGWWMREATTRFWGNVNISAIEGGGFTVILRDLSKRKRDEDDLRALANSDALTGLANRRYLAECGDRELFRARLAGHPLSAMMLDADHFKRTNDVHGHQGGDQVLRAIARLCREHTRDVDVVARYGGEEIVILLPDTDILGARNVAERIRLSIEAYRESVATGVLRATVSIGIATSSADDASLDALIARADAAMYQAKTRGRNRTVLLGASAPEPERASA